ncbi:hypothetical protein GU926_00405 [Nibribacter ruber]|uniref:Uncharacterized protein n=1 Tax=Nibribacter ruber TaxID=2698458 RepID=A0A6P1NW26_9BACT|nr:hypothetical protein [Nibribacter ruber]QHL85985.1 hypothetical protein GU926_00405 [Nibribacter ruber]
MKKISLLLLSLATLTACGDKDEDALGLDYPATFTMTKQYNSTPVRMFTAAGEVIDQAAIKAFARRVNIEYYSLENSTIDVSSWSEQVTFLQAQEAEIKTVPKSEKYEVVQKDADLVLTSRQESTILSPSQTHSVKIANGIMKHQPLRYNEVTLPTSSGVTSSYTTKAQIIASLQGEELHLHKMAHTLKSGDQNSYSLNSSLVSNKFNAAGVALLKATDTLLVQEFVVLGQK